MNDKRYEVGSVQQGNPANEDYFISIRRDKRDITQWDLPLPDAHTIVDELNALQAEVERLRKELAEAQENYHLVNEMVARLRKEGKQSNQ